MDQLLPGWVLVVGQSQSEGGVERSSLGAVGECLRNLIAEKGVPVKGKVDVKATVGSQGRFQHLEASGGFEGAAECAQTHLKNARLPSADTGDMQITFCVRYATE